MPASVSINLCCFNSEKYLEETLESIIAQTWRDWELVIVNDGSTDSTEIIINKYIAKRYQIKYLRQENHGLGYSRNKALELSVGKYIAFIDHDDIWQPDKLEKQIDVLEKNPKIGLTYSNAINFSEANRNIRYLRYRKGNQPSGMIFGELLNDYFLCLSTVIVRKQAVENIDGWFEETFKVAEEADVFLRIAYKWECAYVDHPLTMFRMHPQSSTFHLRKKFPEEKEIILRKLVILYPEITKVYNHEINAFKGDIQGSYALEEIWEDKKEEARKRLLPLVFSSRKAFVIYMLSFLPIGIIKFVYNKLNTYKI